MTRVQRLALPFMVVAVVSAIAPPVFAERTFEGVYIARGADSAGNTYRRAVEIERDDDRYLVTWVSARLTGEGLVLEPTWIGVGLASDDTLSVSFVADRAMGIMVYRFGPNGQLTGRWTLEDADVICAETLTPLDDELPSPVAADPPQEQRARPSSAPAIPVVSL